jgi:hypothetical protein
VERAATDARKTLDGGTHAYLDLVGRVMRSSSDGDTEDSDETAPAKTADPAPSVIIP